ncbi:MAG TPA: glycoside hydrolase family 38 C-terminal domain-containing protein [Gemmatimonadales bacterium]
MSDGGSFTFHIICHTHWDREWYLPAAAFRARLVAAFADLIPLLERERDARFLLDGQTVILDDVHATVPQWQPRSESLVRSGQLEIGPWYILADELIPSGESLVRNLIEGRRDAAGAGHRMDVLYSPDAFGHPSVFPSLAREFGIENAVIWRGAVSPTGSDTDLYWWSGADGSRTLVYHLPPAGYEIGSGLLESPATIADEWARIGPALMRRSATSDVAVFVGADHHAPPISARAIREALEQADPGATFRLSSLTEYFAAVRGAVSGAAIPTIAGERRWSFGHTWTLPGARAIRTRALRRFGAAELLLLRKAEPLAALAFGVNRVDVHELARSARRALLECQFHDTLCGCSSDAVAQEQATRLTAVAAIASEISRRALHKMAHHDADQARTTPTRTRPVMLLWNPAARRRGGIVTATATAFRRDILVGPPGGRIAGGDGGFTPIELVAPDGSAIPVQLLNVAPALERIESSRHYPDLDEVDRSTIAFEAPATPGLGLSALTLRRSTAVPEPTDLEVNSGRLANRFVEVHCGRDGRVDLIDRRSGERYRDLLGLVSETDAGDSYTPEIIAGTAIRASSTVARVIGAGPLVGAIESTLTITRPSGRIRARRILILHADAPALRVRFELDNDATDHRLRTSIPVNARTTVVSGSAFGVEERESVEVDVNDFPDEHPLPTAPAQRFAAVSAGNRGIALFAPGFFEYEWRDETVWLTLIRSVGELSKNTLRARPGHAGWPIATPDAQELGPHLLEFAVAPIAHDDARRVDALEELWEDLFLPLQPEFIRNCSGGSSTEQPIGVTLDGPGLVFTSCKVAESEEGIVLRCYNTTSAPVRGRWVLTSAVAGAARIRADESIVSSLPFGAAGVPFIAEPRAIISVLIRFTAS